MLAQRAQNVILMDGDSGNAGSPGTSRLGHHSQQGTWGQKPASHSQWSLPQEAHVPDGLILQLWPKQGVQLGQDGDEPAARDSRVRGTGHRRDPSYPTYQGKTWLLHLSKSMAGSVLVGTGNGFRICGF